MKWLAWLPACDATAEVTPLLAQARTTSIQYHSRCVCRNPEVRTLHRLYPAFTQSNILVDKVLTLFCRVPWLAVHLRRSQWVVLYELGDDSGRMATRFPWIHPRHAWARYPKHATRNQRHGLREDEIRPRQFAHHTSLHHISLFSAVTFGVKASGRDPIGNLCCV